MPHLHFPSSESHPPPQQSGPRLFCTEHGRRGPPRSPGKSKADLRWFCPAAQPTPAFRTCFPLTALSVQPQKKELFFLPRLSASGPLAMTPSSSLCPLASWKPRPCPWLPAQFRPSHGSSSFPGQPRSFHSRVCSFQCIQSESSPIPALP